MRSFLLIFLLVFTGLTSCAFGFCMEPTAPYYEPQKPSVPYCVNEILRTHTCDEWQISQYNREIENYNSEVEEYINQMRAYVDDAIAYAKCKIDSIINQ